MYCFFHPRFFHHSYFILASNTSAAMPSFSAPVRHLLSKLNGGQGSPGKVKILGFSSNILSIYFICQGKYSLLFRQYNTVFMEKLRPVLSRGDQIDVIDEEDDENKFAIVRRIIITELIKLPGDQVQVDLEVWRKGIRVKDDD